MIKQEEVNGLIRSYSDKGNKIRQIETNIIYDEAIDINPCPYTYEETDEAIEESAEDLLSIITGEQT